MIRLIFVVELWIHIYCSSITVGVAEVMVTVVASEVTVVVIAIVSELINSSKATLLASHRSDI